MQLVHQLERMITLKDKKPMLAALFLPITLIFSGAAIVTEFMPTALSATAPSVASIEAETCVDIPIEIPLSAANNNENIALYQLTEQPKLGAAVIENNVLVYSPGTKTGTDKFSYTAVDTEGNTAKSAEIAVKITKNRAKVTYSDMANNPAHYAAIKLAEAGIMTGETIGENYFFRPTAIVSRSEFIALASTAAKLPLEETLRTDFIDDSGLSAWAKPYVSTAAANGLISGYQTAGGLAEVRGEKPITLAEASVIIDNLLSGEDGTLISVINTEEHSTNGYWASPAMNTLNRLGILSASAMDYSNAEITRQTACELLYHALSLMND